jgi:hypothetical protein
MIGVIIAAILSWGVPSLISETSLTSIIRRANCHPPLASVGDGNNLVLASEPSA